MSFLKDSLGNFKHTYTHTENKMLNYTREFYLFKKKTHKKEKPTMSKCDLLLDIKTIRR